MRHYFVTRHNLTDVLEGKAILTNSMNKMYERGYRYVDRQIIDYTVITTYENEMIEAESQCES